MCNRIWHRVVFNNVKMHAWISNKNWVICSELPMGRWGDTWSYEIFFLSSTWWWRVGDPFKLGSVLPIPCVRWKLTASWNIWLFFFFFLLSFSFCNFTVYNTFISFTPLSPCGSVFMWTVLSCLKAKRSQDQPLKV